ncbi:hypothetical protein ACFYOK_04400 [Microbispora bryophytorum]|uniref:hypothetical protein n=1 Tax=Microbispora bryophytorum TaxID=1460882 RepID=UPI0033F5A477
MEQRRTGPLVPQAAVAPVPEVVDLASAVGERLVETAVEGDVDEPGVLYVRTARPVASTSAQTPIATSVSPVYSSAGSHRRGRS